MCSSARRCEYIRRGIKPVIQYTETGGGKGDRSNLSTSDGLVRQALAAIIGAILDLWLSTLDS